MVKRMIKEDCIVVTYNIAELVRITNESAANDVWDVGFEKFVPHGF